MSQQKLYHWTKLSSTPEEGLKGDLESNYKVCFSIHPTSHSNFGNNCFSIDVNEIDIPQQFLGVFRRRNETIERYNENPFNVDESDLEIDFDEVPQRLLTKV